MRCHIASGGAELLQVVPELLQVSHIASGVPKLLLDVPQCQIAFRCHVAALGYRSPGHPGGRVSLRARHPRLAKAALSHPGSPQRPWPAPQRAAGCGEHRKAAPRHRGAQRVRTPGRHTGRKHLWRSAACLALELRPYRLPRVVPPAHDVRLAYPLLLHNTVPGPSVPVSMPPTPRANAAPAPKACSRLSTVACALSQVAGYVRGVAPRSTRRGRLVCGQVDRVRPPAPLHSHRFKENP